jgi:DNA-binding IclR family transcriptional regulator
MAQEMKSEFHPVEQPGAADGSTTRTLSRGLAVLSAILDSDVPPTLTQLAMRTGLSKATVSRLLATLTETGFASQPPGGQVYYVGPSIARWLRTSPMEALLVQQAAPVLNELRDLSGETCVLCVPVWPDRVCVLCSLAPSPVRAQKAVGEIGALTRGSSGRAFLAFAKDPYVDAALQARPLTRMTPNSITEVGQFMRQLQKERGQGYSISVEGTFPDMNGIGVPVFAAGAAMPVAIIDISGPSSRWTGERMQEFAPALKARAAQLSSYFTSERMS